MILLEQQLLQHWQKQLPTQLELEPIENQLILLKNLLKYQHFLH
jgi:hypothetical protein